MKAIRLGIRLFITGFVLILITIAVLGIQWTSTHQKPPLSTASAIVLGIAGLSGAFAVFRIWRADDPPGRPHQT